MSPTTGAARARRVRRRTSWSSTAARARWASSRRSSISRAARRCCCARAESRATTIERVLGRAARASATRRRRAPRARSPRTTRRARRSRWCDRGELDAELAAPANVAVLALREAPARVRVTSWITALDRSRALRPRPVRQPAHARRERRQAHPGRGAAAVPHGRRSTTASRAPRRARPESWTTSRDAAGWSLAGRACVRSPAARGGEMGCGRGFSPRPRSVTVGTKMSSVRPSRST